MVLFSGSGILTPHSQNEVFSYAKNMICRVPRRNSSSPKSYFSTKFFKDQIRKYSGTDGIFSEFQLYEIMQFQKAQKYYFFSLQRPFLKEIIFILILLFPGILVIIFIMQLHDEFLHMYYVAC